MGLTGGGDEEHSTLMAMKVASRLFWIWGMVAGLCLLSGATTQASPLPPDAISFSHPVWSLDNSRLALSDSGGNGVYVYNLDDQTLVRLTDALGSGAWYNWSPDGRGLGFKILQPPEGDDFPPQLPAIYRVDSGTVETLLPATRRAGVPSFSADGRVAFSLGSRPSTAEIFPPA